MILFEKEFNNEIFETLYESNENPLDGKELEEKIVSLYSVTSNMIDAASKTDETESLSPVYSTNNYVTKNATYNGWIDLIDDLNVHGSVVLSDYDNIDASLFKGYGWQYDKQWGSTPYSFASYSKVNAPGEFLTQFSLVDIITQSNQGVDDFWEASMQANYYDGMVVQYTEYNDTLSVIYYGFGISYNNFQVGINLEKECIRSDTSLNYLMLFTKKSLKTEMSFQKFSSLVIDDVLKNSDQKKAISQCSEYRKLISVLKEDLSDDKISGPNYSLSVDKIFDSIYNTLSNIF